MKKLMLGMIVSAAIAVLPSLAFAQSVTCATLSGASIYGYQGYALYGESNWKFIGTVSNPFSVNSIANEFGQYGSEFNVNSINDTFGSFGSQFSMESAFDEFATNPPVLVTEGGSWGYLTTNQYKYPSINPYFALECAQEL